MIAAFAALLLQASVPDLGWMSGRWETSSDGGERWTEEVWSEQRGGLMLGYSRMGRGDTVGEWEFLRIAPGAEAVLAYYPQPDGRPPVAFQLVAHDASSATFENPDHDFPQRIRYARNGDTLVATISAMDGSRARSWTYRRQ